MYFVLLLGVSAFEDSLKQKRENLWEFDGPFRVRIQIATFITVTESGQVGWAIRVSYRVRFALDIKVSSYAYYRLPLGTNRDVTVCKYICLECMITRVARQCKT